MVVGDGASILSISPLCACDSSINKGHFVEELSFSLLEIEIGMGRAVFLIFFCSVGQGGEGKRVDEFLDSIVAHQVVGWGQGFQVFHEHQPICSG